MNKLIINKYQIPTPRYRTYPPVSYWQPTVPTIDDWFNRVRFITQNKHPLSLYIHLPHCDKLFGGCDKRITENQNVKKTYINALIEEWNLYKKDAFQQPVTIQEIHLGGGIPTFFSPLQLEYLIVQILKNQILTDDASLSFQAYPGNTTKQHLKTLYQIGFRKISFGVQEFSPIILKAINRKQTTEQVIELTKTARKIGFTSINYDLLYGLPHQTLEDIHLMMDQVQNLRPDRIAFYGYIDGSCIKTNSVQDIPTGLVRWNLFAQGKKSILDMGYREVGMEHFALPSDELVLAAKEGSLYHNSIGYTPKFTNLLIGLGASAISDGKSIYVQNEKEIERYQELITQRKLSIVREHQLTQEDEMIRRHILNIMCQYRTNWTNTDFQSGILQGIILRLQSMVKDGLIKLYPNQGLRVTTKGRPFIRNIAMMFDTYYWSNQQSKKDQFSSTL